MKSIALATCAHVPEPNFDDAYLVAALATRGIRGVPLIWDAPARAEAIDAVIVRSVWDYHLHHKEFLAWVAEMGGRVPFWNDPALVAWNSHKIYLRDLAGRGVSVVPTLWAEDGKVPNIATEAESRGWGDLVVKPAVSASAYMTARFAANARGSAQAHLEKIAAAGTAMVQPYLPSVDSYGERSFIFIDGRFTHGVKRQPVLRQKFELEAPAPRVEPAEAELALCRRTLESLPQPPLYARVDIARDLHEAPCLMELELIEPRLYFREAPECAEALASAIQARLA